jgi:hypothetical protein
MTLIKISKFLTIWSGDVANENRLTKTSQLIINVALKIFNSCLLLLVYFSIKNLIE